MKLRLATAVLILAMTGAAAFGATYGTVRVLITDTTGAPIPGATAEANSPVFIGTRSAVSDMNGVAVLTALVPGRYTIRVSLSGFQPVRLTTSVEQNTVHEVAATLTMQTVAESITVSAEAPLVETKAATVSDHVTLEEVEALPVSRDYRAYAQLVSGVGVVPNQGGRDIAVDPSSKGGNNYRDRTGEGKTGGTGSRDNQYYLDGLIITDIYSGEGSMTFNNEVILEQQVITSGVSAEFAGGKGFVGNIVTKSGGNDFSGSINYYLMSPDFYGDFESSDTRLHTALEDKSDAALTFGGPIVRDRAWFYLSGQVRDNTDEVQLSTSASPNGGTETYQNARENYFGKLTFKPTEQTTLVGQYFEDARETSGSTDVNLPPSRYTTIESIPTTIWGSGQHLFGGDFLLEGRVGEMKWDYFQLAAHPELGPLNDIVYASGVSIPAFERRLGGSSTNFTQVQKRTQGELSATWFLNTTSAGTHAVKGGLEYNKLQDMIESTFFGGMQFESIAPQYSGITFREAYEANIFRSDYNYVYDKLAAAKGSSAFTFADKNGDGVLSQSEYDNLTFSSSAGNSGGLNFFRDFIVASGANNVKQDYNVLFLQDDWSLNDFTINAGVRIEDLEYIASDNSTIVDLDPTFAPRLGFTWDIGGLGRQKVSAFFGRYYDPIRMDMAHFAGNISGRVLDEQIWIGEDWFTYRVRGSRERRDAGFAPNIETPYQDEYSVTWGINVRPTIGFTAQVYRRSDHNLIDDYDPAVYFDPSAGELQLTPDDFGYPASGPGNVNYFLANLVGGEREHTGIDLALDRRFEGNWSGSVQYSWKKGEGNTSSDANADLQGDLLEVDPRQPYMNGRLPGTIPHQVKLYGMYRTPLRLEVGGLLYWSSGAYFTEGDRAYGIIIPHDLTEDDPGDFNFTEIGQKQHPSYTLLDAKVRYQMPLFATFDLDLFLDVYNVLDNQDALYYEVVHNDNLFPTFGETRAVLEPRRFQVGARLTF